MTLWSEQISSLYKIRSVSDLPEQELSRQTVLRGEHFSYQIILRADYNVFCRFSARVFGPDGAENEALTAALRLYRLRPAAMDYPAYPDHDEDILTDEPGLMPDILEPLEESSGMLRLSGPRPSCFRWIRRWMPRPATMRSARSASILSRERRRSCIRRRRC